MAGVRSALALCALFLLPAAPVCAQASLTAQRETSRYVVVDGMVIHYYETGNPSGRPIVFLHGLYGSAVDFLPLMRIMKPDFKCIAVDWPGCGLSEKPDIHYSTVFIVELLKKFTDTIGLDGFILAGHSLGGMVSVHFAILHRESVEKLILIDPYGLRGEEGGFLPLARLGCLIDAAFALTTELFVDIALKAYIFRDPDRMPHEYFASVMRTFADPDSRRAVARITREIIGTDPVDALLPGVSQEVLLIWGMEDRLLPASWHDGFAKGLPHVTLRLVPECGHMPIVERPGQTAWLLEEFLSD
jgi:pimeloyl-ACP methyl ester carboxylesterase